MQISGYCIYCRNFRPNDLITTTNSIIKIRCNAFPDKNIPSEILTQVFDHRNRFEGDKNIIFEPQENLTNNEINNLFKKF
jgi:hypothetical protein